MWSELNVLANIQNKEFSHIPKFKDGPPHWVPATSVSGVIRAEQTGRRTVDRTHKPQWGYSCCVLGVTQVSHFACAFRASLLRIIWPTFVVSLRIIMWLRNIINKHSRSHCGHQLTMKHWSDRSNLVIDLDSQLQVCRLSMLATTCTCTCTSQHAILLTQIWCLDYVSQFPWSCFYLRNRCSKDQNADDVSDNFFNWDTGTCGA